MIVSELHSTFLSTADDLVHKSKGDQLEILLKESLYLCHHQPDLAAKTRAVSSTSHDWSWTHPVHSLSHKMHSSRKKKLLSKFSREQKSVHLPHHGSMVAACSHE